MITSQSKRALAAAFLGFMLDGMDVMLYSLVLQAVQKDLHLTPAISGLLMSFTLVTAAIGGIVFGRLADRWGRAKAMIASILVYSIFTGLSGLAQNVWQLAIFRLCLGLGMGGEWATGATLVAETWPPEHRGKALGFLQSSWAWGYAAAVLVNWIVAPRFGWRAVFFVGVLPALVAIWIWRGVEEPQMWRDRAEQKPAPISMLFRGRLGWNTLVATSMNAATLFAWWGLFTWVPSFLALPVDRGGRGLLLAQSSGWMLLMQAGAFVGYVSFGFIADRWGARRTYAAYLLVSAVAALSFYLASDPLTLIVLSPVLGFFCTGCFSGFSILASGMFPTAVRGSALGFTYNLGRIASAVAPFTIGRLSESLGLGVAFVMTAVAYLVAAVISTAAEESTGKALD